MSCSDDKCTKKFYTLANDDFVKESSILKIESCLGSLHNENCKFLNDSNLCCSGSHLSTSAIDGNLENRVIICSRSKAIFFRGKDDILKRISCFSFLVDILSLYAAYYSIEFGLRPTKFKSKLETSDIVIQLYKKCNKDIHIKGE